MQFLGAKSSWKRLTQIEYIQYKEQWIKWNYNEMLNGCEKMLIDAISWFKKNSTLKRKRRGKNAKPN